MDKIYKITKVSETSSKPSPQIIKTVKKPTKTYPKSNLKKTARILPVQDPAKSPPLKKGSRRFTMRLKLNDKKSEKIRKEVKSMNDKQIDKVLEQTPLNVKENTPKHLKEEILMNAKIAGFVSS